VPSAMRESNLAKRPRFAPELIDSLQESTRSLGCEVGYFMMTSTEGERTFQRVILDCDATWALEYAERECFRADPWMRYALSHSAPIRASDVPCINAGERATVQLAARFGFDHAALIPSPAPEGQARVGLLVLGGSAEVVGTLLATPFQRAMARDLSMVLHERWVQDSQHITHREIQLSRLEARLLELELEGLGAKAMARQLHTTSASIHSRFQRLNRRIGVNSRREAALLCLDRGLIKAVDLIERTCREDCAS
jgi:DNA-binding CsgD family transcriptional regulator